MTGGRGADKNAHDDEDFAQKTAGNTNEEATIQLKRARQEENERANNIKSA